MSVLFALVAAVGWGSSDFAVGRSVRKSSPAATIILAHLVSVVVLLFVAVRFGSGGLTIDGSPTTTDIAWGLAAGVAGGAGVMLFLRGSAKGSMAIVAPITAICAAMIAVLFGIVTGDPVTVFGIIGIAMALVAIALVSLTGVDGTEPGDDLDDLDDLDDPMVVPDGWSDEFQLPSPSGTPLDPAGPRSTLPPGPSPSGSATPPAPVPGVAWMPAPTVGATRLADDAPQPALASASAAPLAAPPIEMVHSSSPAPQAPRFGIHDGELRMPLRTVRQAVLALVTTAVLSAAAIASRPIDQLLDGEEYTGTIAAQLVFSLVVVGLAAFALNNVKPLFDFSDLTRRRDPSAVRGEPSNAALSWKAIVGQPGVADALIAGLGFGLFFVFISRASEDAGQWPLVSARAVSVVMMVLIAVAGSTRLLPERGSRLPVALAGLLDAAAAVCFVLAVRNGLLSAAAMLAALFPIVIVVLLRVSAKERIGRVQVVGLGLACCAIGLLAI